MALSERRKRLRKALRAIGRRLKIIFSSARLIIRRALTREVEYAVAVLHKVGLEKMAELEESVQSGKLRGEGWLAEARIFLDEKAEEAGVKVDLSDSELLLVRQLLFPSYEKEQGKET